MFKENQSRIDFAIHSAIAELTNVRDESNKPEDIDLVLKALTVLQEKERMRAKEVEHDSN